MTADSVDKKAILVVDDDSAVLSLLNKLLTHAGHEVKEATNGAEAVKLLNEFTPDFILTDLWMPQMNGVEFIEEYNKKNLPAEVVVLSGHIAESSTQKLTALGVFGILSKPFQVDELLKITQEALASNRLERLSGDEKESDTATHATVLIADDDRTIRELERQILTTAGYKVVEAVNGLEAVEKVLAYDIDLVVTDLNMPEMDGVEAIQKLRSATRDTFIVCVTGEASQAEISAALRAGATKCFRKPINVEELLAEVKRMDLLATHRKRLVEREKDMLATKVPSRGGGSRKLIIVASIIVILLALIAIPITRAIRNTIDKAADTIDGAANNLDRIEGYLERDEQRELVPRR